MSCKSLAPFATQLSRHFDAARLTEVGFSPAVKLSLLARLPGLIVVCFGRFWVRDLPFPKCEAPGARNIKGRSSSSNLRYLKNADYGKEHPYD